MTTTTTDLIIVAAIMVFGLLGILSFEQTTIFLLTAIAIFVVKQGAL